MFVYEVRLLLLIFSATLLGYVCLLTLGIFPPCSIILVCSLGILLDMSLNCIGARLVHTRVHVMSNSKQMLHALVAVVCLYSLCLSLSSLCPLPSRLNILLSDSLYKVGNIVRVPFHAT